MKYHYTAPRMANIKNMTVLIVGRNKRLLEYSSTPGEGVSIRTATLGTCVGTPATASPSGPLWAAPESCPPTAGMFTGALFAAAHTQNRLSIPQQWHD